MVVRKKVKVVNGGAEKVKVENGGPHPKKGADIHPTWLAILRMR